MKTLVCPLMSMHVCQCQPDICMPSCMPSCMAAHGVVLGMTQPGGMTIIGAKMKEANIL